MVTERKPVRYVCSEILSPTHDIRLITLLPKTAELIEFIPGQYIEALLSPEQSLPLSIANAPNAQGALHFHIRLYPNTLGQVFWEIISTKKEIDLLGPYGNFIPTRLLPTLKPLFLAGGVGLAPIQSFLSALLPKTNENPCHLFWGIKDAQECYAEDLLQKWQASFPYFKYTIALSEPHHSPEWRGEQGLIHECVIRHYPQLHDKQVFACGPRAMMHAAYKSFKTLGMKSEHFISDVPVTLDFSA